MSNKILLSAIVAAGMVFGAGSASAAIVKPTGVDASSSFNNGFLATNAINGSGLSSSLSTGDPVPTTWPTSSNQNGGGGILVEWWQ